MYCLLDRPNRMPRPRAGAVLRAASKLPEFFSRQAGAERRVLRPNLCRGGQLGRPGSRALLQTIFDGVDRFVLVYTA